MSEIIEHPNNDREDEGLVQVGDKNFPVSLKLYQDIYHQVTGRTEQIRKRSFDNLLLEYDDIEQLHHKIMQLCDVHRVIAKNETIAVFHEMERKEQFTSFERFKAYNANATSPCVSIILKYNFAIIPAGLLKPQEYVLSFRLLSRVALLEQLDGEAPPFLRGGGYFGYIHESTAEVTIDYADYVIARGFLETFDEWAKGCKSVPQSQILNFFRRHSHLAPLIGRIFIASLISWLFWNAAETLSMQGASLTQWVRFGLLYTGSCYVFVSLMAAVASYVENSIDGYPELSYLKLNKGDERLIEKFSQRRRHVILRFVWASAVSIGLGICSSRLDRLL